MLSGETIVCLSSIDWDFNWQGHQEIMSRLAERGNRVLFVENTGVRAVTVRDVPRLGRRIRNWWRSGGGFRDERKNLSVYSPLALPFPYSGSARLINRVVLGRALRRWMRAVDCARPIVWTFLPTPLCRDLARALNPELTVYYCIDDLPNSSPAARRVGGSEVELFRSADLVFVTVQKLKERAERWREQVDVFPFAVDYEKFKGVRTSAGGAPADLAGFARPLVGYVGALSHKLDRELLVDVAERIPEATFTLVGPVQCDVGPLLRRPNIRLLGARAHDDVPRYLKAFGAGIIPYRLTPYTETVYPTKLNEYLAMGIPVVSTPLPEVLRFNARHGDPVVVAGQAPAFAEGLRGALEADPAGAVERRIAVARQNDWEARMEPMMACLEAALARPGEAAAGAPEPEPSRKDPASGPRREW
jgi:glycosyltransferase involved in cell wall biosynthesis